MNKLDWENSTEDARRAFAGTLSCDRCGKIGSTRQTFLNEGDDEKLQYLCYSCALLRAIQLRFEGTPIATDVGLKRDKGIYRGLIRDTDICEGVIGQLMRWVEFILPDELERLRAESERL